LFEEKDPMFDTDMLIGETFVAGAEAGERVLNPKTGELILDHPEASLQQVEAAVGAAEKAFPKWSGTTPAERSALLLKLADTIERNAESLAALEALNCGKPRVRVLNDEIPAIADCFRFFAGAVRTMHGAVAGEYLAGHTSMIRRDPIGVADNAQSRSPRRRHLSSRRSERDRRARRDGRQCA
jgi:aminobutyraldehyde dehydrogenase